MRQIKIFAKGYEVTLEARDAGEQAAVTGLIGLAHRTKGGEGLSATGAPTLAYRGRYPAAHRVVGRVYVAGGVIPAGVIGLTIGAVRPFGPAIRVSNVLLATLGMTFTITGVRMARQRRFIEHRRWMIRSFALTMSIITNRVWAAIAFVVVMPELATTFDGNETMMVHTIAGLAGWLGWVTTLLFAEWWLERGDTATLRARPSTRR